MTDSATLTPAELVALRQRLRELDNPGGFYSQSPIFGQAADAIGQLMAENAALSALLPSASHGFARLRAFVDPAVPRGQKKDAGREPL